MGLFRVLGVLKNIILFILYQELKDSVSTTLENSTAETRKVMRGLDMFR